MRRFLLLIAVAACLGGAHAQARWEYARLEFLLDHQKTQGWVTLTRPEGVTRYGATGNAYQDTITVVAERMGIPAGMITANDVLVIANYLGLEGWELVSHAKTLETSAVVQVEVFVFKRPAP